MSISPRLAALARAGAALVEKVSPRTREAVKATAGPARRVADIKAIFESQAPQQRSFQSTKQPSSNQHTFVAAKTFFKAETPSSHAFSPTAEATQEPQNLLLEKKSFLETLKRRNAQRSAVPQVSTNPISSATQLSSSRESTKSNLSSPSTSPSHSSISSTTQINDTPKHGAKADSATQSIIMADIQNFLDEPEEKSEVSKRPPSPAARGLFTKFFGSSKEPSTSQNTQQETRRKELEKAKSPQERLAEVINGKSRAKADEQQKEELDRKEFELGILAQQHLGQIRNGELPRQEEFEFLHTQFSERKKPWPHLSNLMDKIGDAYKDRFIEGLRKRIQLFLRNKKTSIEEYQDRMKRASSQVEKEKIKEEWRSVLMRSVPFIQKDAETFNRLTNTLSH